MDNRIIIVGGMGPQASLHLHDLVLRNAAKAGARNGDEFPEILHLSLPVKDFISDQSKAGEALEFIAKSIRCLYPWQPRPISLSL